MTNHDQANIIREQMQANQRIIKAASSSSGRIAVSRVPLSERMKRLVTGEGTGVKPSSRPPKSNR